MSKNRFQILTIFVFLIFVYSCTKSTIYVAPIEKSEIRTAKKIIIKLADGTELALKNVQVDAEQDKIIGYTEDQIKKEIDFSSIQSVMLEKGPDQAVIILAGGVAVVSAWLLIGAATAPEPPPMSCPFIYSFDGKKFIFDAEPYGGAICRKLKRTELCRLEYLKEINGEYKIWTSSELNETQYIDELNLVVVDHPTNVQVVPDVAGVTHTISQPTAPLRAYDSKGRDIGRLIARNDGLSWETCVAEKNPDMKEDLRDELFFEFPKPNNVKKAKLLINACNTLWGSHALKRYLDLYGNGVYEWYDEVNNLGPAFFKMVNLHLREQLYSLQINLKTETGWKSKGIIFGGGLLASENKVYPIDISDVPGDTLSIKLTPPVPFWTINYMAIDYTEDVPIKVTEIAAKEARTDNGEDVQELVTKQDNNYLVMANIGDKAEIVFKSPPKSNGVDRSIFLKASGYYDMHLKAEGEPQLAILERFESESGFVLQYSFREYLNWRKIIFKH